MQKTLLWSFLGLGLGTVLVLGFYIVSAWYQEASRKRQAKKIMKELNKKP